jgi:predicted dehydrogenase
MGSEVRLGVVGLGGMGRTHLGNILSGKVTRCRVVAVSDNNPGALEIERDPRGLRTLGGAAAAAQVARAERFADARELIRSGGVEAVLIATPHFSHTTLGIAALEAGLHVMMEKPISVHKADCQRLLAAHRNERQVFAAMLHQRTDPRYRKLKELLTGGEMGEIFRITWIATTWYRPQAYFASGKWRGTWTGEGGGVLLNQGIHQLDLWQWLFGLPLRVTARAGFGRDHRVPVEDDVSASLEYSGGTMGQFMSSTGECPGTNRLEVAGEHGRLVLEGDALSIDRVAVSLREHSRSCAEPFGSPELEREELRFTDSGGEHARMLQNFVDAILEGAPLIAPAAEGMASVELANAMLLSALEGQTVELPLDAAAYERKLEALKEAERSARG